MDGAIGFSGEKSTGKVILEPIAKNKVEFVTLCNVCEICNMQLLAAIWHTKYYHSLII